MFLLQANFIRHNFGISKLCKLHVNNFQVKFNMTQELNAYSILAMESVIDCGA